MTGGRNALGSTLIEIDGVSVDLGARRVLQNVSFQVPRGAIVAVVGPSGAGKTTLFRAICGLVPLSSGLISVVAPGSSSVDGAITADLRVAMVFQGNALLDRLSALQNVLLGFVDGRSRWIGTCGWPRALQMRAAAALEQVGILHLAHQKVDRISGGEKQRVGIARALVRQPDLLLADEPFSAVDPVRRENLQRVMLDHCRQHGASMLITLHDLDTAASMADLVISLDAGRVIFRGAAHRFRSANTIQLGLPSPLWARNAHADGRPDRYQLI